MTSLNFGLTMTGLGMLAMFSALALIIVACEILKRMFKEPETKTFAAGVIVEEVPSEKEKISEEEVIAITVAVTAYIETPPTPKLVTTLKSGIQPAAWNMAGRRELMELRIRR